MAISGRRCGRRGSGNAASRGAWRRGAPWRRRSSSRPIRRRGRGRSGRSRRGTTLLFVFPPGEDRPRHGEGKNGDDCVFVHGLFLVGLGVKAGARFSRFRGEQSGGIKRPLPMSLLQARENGLD